MAPPDDEELPGAHGEAQAPLGRAPVPPPRLELGELAQRAPELAEVRPLLLAGLVFHVPHALEAGANDAEEDEVDGTTRARRPRRGALSKQPLGLALCRGVSSGLTLKDADAVGASVGAAIAAWYRGL